MFAIAGGAAVVLAGAMVLTSGNRMGRISTWLAGACSDPNGTGFQTCHGLYALADGGWWGVGLGASREKWQWLPEAHNDFIFAIIGEELGLPGTLAVMGLFAVLALACYRLVARTDDFFIRIASAGVMVWILGPGDHQHRLGHRRCCRSSGCRCRWSPPEGRPSSPRCSGWAC